jgi:hypothetical protein
MGTQQLAADQYLHRALSRVTTTGASDSHTRRAKAKPTHLVVDRRMHLATDRRTHLATDRDINPA